MPPAPQVTDLIAWMTLEEKIGQLTMAERRLRRHRPAGRGQHRRGRARRPGRQPLQPLGPRCGARGAARRRRGDAARHPALLRLRRHPRLPHDLPDPLAEAGAFDPALWEATAPTPRRRPAAAGIDLTFAPMLDIARDPRWGRIAEGAGEDPCLGARFAEAKVRGFQGADLARPTHRRDRQALRRLRRQRRPAATTPRSTSPSARCARSTCRRSAPRSTAGAAAIMPAFTDIAGVPMTANRALLHGHAARALGLRRRRRQRLRRRSASWSGTASPRTLAEAAALALERRGRHRHDVAAPIAAACPRRSSAASSTMADHRRRRRARARPQGIGSACSRIPTAAAPGPIRRRRHAAAAPRGRRASRAAARRAAAEQRRRAAACPAAPRPRSPSSARSPTRPARCSAAGPAAGRGDEAVSLLRGLRAALPEAAIEHVARRRRSRRRRQTASPAARRGRRTGRSRDPLPRRGGAG